MNATIGTMFAVNTTPSAVGDPPLYLSRHRVLGLPHTESGPGYGNGIEWQEGTSQVLRWLLAGRTWGPVFVTDRKAPARTAVTHQARPARPVSASSVMLDVWASRKNAC